MKSKLWLCASAVLLTFGLLTQQMGGAPRTTAVRTAGITAPVIPRPTTTTVPPTTTTTAAPAPPPTRPRPHPASRSYVRPVPAPAPPAAAPATNGWPARVLHAQACSDNGPHDTALAHQCWDGLLAQYPWSQATAFRIMMCESNGNPWDGNPSGARGLMQILSRDSQGRPIGSFDPSTNMAQAWEKYRGAGYSWSPWVCR